MTANVLSLGGVTTLPSLILIRYQSSQDAIRNEADVQIRVASLDRAPMRGGDTRRYTPLGRPKYWLPKS